MDRLVVGVGCSLGCSYEELADLVAGTLGRKRRPGARHLADPQHLVDDRGTVVAVATVDRRAGEPCVTALAAGLGVPLRTFTAAELAAVMVPNPSATVARHVGTPSVAEAAALRASGGALVVGKRRSPRATCAIARELPWPA